ncbi:alpha/beta fold hydrolase [Opitutales bacterium]|nr:alpha/beta fold hydrolase [Opitutales bacterium]
MIPLSAGSAFFCGFSSWVLASMAKVWLSHVDMEETIKNQDEEIIEYTFHAGQENARNLLIIGHGLTGNKDRPFVVALAEAVAAEGLPVLRFSFSGNGGSGGDFRQSTISKEVDDLKAVLSAADASGYRVIYAGHSMGGAVGVLAAASDERIKLLISLAGMVNTQAFYEREFGEVTPDSGCMWEEASCPLSSTFKDDLESIITTAPKASEVKVPWLLVHGTEDDVVPIEDSQEIFAHANEPKKLVEIPGANHVFSEAGEKPMIDAVIDWIGDSLR